MRVTVKPYVVRGLERSPTASKRDWWEWRSEAESRRQHYQDQLEYLKEFWRREEICCPSNFSEKPPVKTGVKKLEKNKECEKKDKYLARKLKKLWNMQVIIIPIVVGAFGTVTKGLLKGLEDLEVGGRVETIQTTTLLRTARTLRRVLETWGDLLPLKLQWKIIS